MPTELLNVWRTNSSPNNFILSFLKGRYNTIAASIRFVFIIIKYKKKYIMIIVETKPRLLFNSRVSKPDALDLIELSVSLEIRLKWNFFCKTLSACFMEFVIKSGFNK